MLVVALVAKRIIKLAADRNIVVGCSKSVDSEDVIDGQYGEWE